MSDASDLAILRHTIQEEMKKIHVAITDLSEEFVGLWGERNARLRDELRPHVHQFIPGCADEDLNLATDYLTAATFLAAKFQATGDKKQSNHIALLTSVMLSPLGIALDDAIVLTTVVERVWRRELRSRGIGQSGRLGCLIICFVLIGLLYLVLK